MSQPDRAHAAVPRVRPASAPAAAPLRVVSERVRPDVVATPTPTGPAQLRAAFRDASATPAPLAMSPCPQPWPAPAWPAGGAGFAAPAPVMGQPVHLAAMPAGSADLVPARSLLPVPACPPPARTLLARLMDLVTGRRDPTGRHRQGSIESPTWSMCARRRRRSWWRAPR